MKLSYIFLGAILSTGVLLSSCGKEKKNSLSQADKQELQQNSKEFLQGVFPGMLVTDYHLIKKDNYKKSVLSTTLDKQLSIDFNKQGDWTQVKSIDHTALPNSFLDVEIPLIHSYVKANFPLNFIIEVERIEKQGYEVELNSQFELIFDHNQKYIGIDLDHDDSEELISFDDFPQTAKTFINANFPNSQVVLSNKETDGRKTFLKAYLSEGVKVEFNKKGDWIEVSTKSPQGIHLPSLPIEITTYIQTKYPKYTLMSVEKNQKDYEIEIEKADDYIALVFSLKGEFIKID